MERMKVKNKLEKAKHERLVTPPTGPSSSPNQGSRVFKLLLVLMIFLFISAFLQLVFPIILLLRRRPITRAQFLSPFFPQISQKISNYIYTFTYSGLFPDSRLAIWTVGSTQHVHEVRCPK